MGTTTKLTALAALALVAGGCAGSGPADDTDGRVPSGGPSTTGVPVAGAELWLSFDEVGTAHDGTPEYADAQGAAHAGQVHTANDGALRTVEGPDGRGDAVGFPELCTAPDGCPRALVEVPAHPALEPGSAPFLYAASVRLPASQTSDGSNIVQSGRFGTAGGQWKLQVDGDEGLPSCIIRSGDDILSIRSRTSVADDAWHRVVCRLDDDSISIEVDGVVRRHAAEVGPVHSGLPIRIGSAGTGDRDDQFHGSVDDVVLDIDPQDAAGD